MIKWIVHSYCTLSPEKINILQVVSFHAVFFFQKLCKSSHVIYNKSKRIVKTLSSYGTGTEQILRRVCLIKIQIVQYLSPWDAKISLVETKPICVNHSILSVLCIKSLLISARKILFCKLLYPVVYPIAR